MVQKNETSGINYVPSNFVVHRFESEVLNSRIIFQVVKMVDSLLIFINYREDLKFTDLSMAAESRYDTLPVQTQLIGSFIDDSSRSLAGKFSKKLNKTVFVSYNVLSDNIVTPVVQKALFDEIKRHPSVFH